MRESEQVSNEELAHEICRVLRRNGRQAFLVGGCVRDRLLGRPVEDFDIATDARPGEVAALFPGCHLVGAHFGVAAVHRGDARVEVATFRSDGPYSDHRRPDSVRFETDPRADALRRDFTINALFLDPATGEILDFAGGRQDLAQGVVRAIGDPAARFAEDHLRLLRAVRFAARLGFTIEPRTATAIQESRQGLLTVAPERTRAELDRILTEGGARPGFEWLNTLGLLDTVLPEVAAMRGVAQPPQYHPEGDVWTHTLLMLGAMENPSLSLAWGILLHDVGKPPTFRVAERIRFDGHATVGARIAVEILTRLRAPGAVVQRVDTLVAEHLRFIDVPRMRESTLRRFLREPHFEELLELHRLDCLSSHRNLGTYEALRRRLGELEAEELRPPPLVRGGDLIAMGYAPGPRFREVLAAVEDAQLESRVSRREEALELARRLLDQNGR